MRIKLWIVDERDGEVLEELGNCLCSNPGRAVQMYEDELDKWNEKGYWAEIHWKDITDSAAASLGSRGGKSTSDAKRKASAANGKLGGRPRKSE